MSDGLSRRHLLALGVAGVTLTATDAEAQDAKKRDPTEEPKELTTLFSCRVKYLNSAPGTTIIRTLAVFTYSDGTSTSDPSSGMPGEVNIGHGEAGYRYSNDKCVKKIYTFMAWNSGSGDGEITAPSGQCITEAVHELEPAALVPENSKERGRQFDLIIGADKKVRGPARLSERGKKLADALKDAK